MMFVEVFAKRKRLFDSTVSQLIIFYLRRTYKQLEVGLDSYLFVVRGD
jgi:hypothetical protein